MYQKTVILLFYIPTFLKIKRCFLSIKTLSLFTITSQAKYVVVQQNSKMRSL